MTHHVIVGSGIAALSAAESIRRADDRAVITMIGEERESFYSRPGLAYLLTNEVTEEQLSIRTPDAIGLLNLRRVPQRATGLNPAEHEVELLDHTRVRYDRLLIATGASSIAAQFPGHQLEGVVQVDGLAEARALVERTRSARAAVVIGGGSTALELVDALIARGIVTHYLMRGDRYWSRVFDEVESAIVEARLIKSGVVLHRQTVITEAVGDDGRLTGVRTSTGEQIQCEILATAVGVRPRIELAVSAGLVTDRGILTNQYLETSAEQVYAAGDVAQVHDPVTRLAQLDTLWASALQQGRIAGLNMAGVRVAYRKSVPMNVTRVAGITVTIIGAVGSGSDPDLLTITRGQSERWVTDATAWSIGGARQSDRLRVIVSGRAIVGAVVMGNQRVSHRLSHLIGEEVDISALRPLLDAAPPDAMDLLLKFCDEHVHDRAAHRSKLASDSTMSDRLQHQTSLHDASRHT